MVFSGDNFYWQLISKYNATFGMLFSDITIKRSSTDTTINQNIKVPLYFGTKEKMQARVEALPNADRQFAVQLPAIAYEYPIISYSTDRKLISVNRNVIKNSSDKNSFLVQYNPWPADLHYKLYIYAKNIEDGNKIIEQILPFFTPDFTVSMELVPDMNDYRDIPTILKGNVNFSDNGKQDSETERRILVWTLEFIMHAFLFGPKKIKPVIKFIQLNQRLDDTRVAPDATSWPIPLSNSSPIVGTVTQYPGLTANGVGTYDPTQTIDWHNIAVDDEWDMIVQYTNTQAGANT